MAPELENIGADINCPLWSAQVLEESLEKWFSAGAQIIGGCCRTRPAHIRQVAALITNV